MAMLVTMQSASIVNAGYELVQIKAQMAALEKNNDQLKLDIAKLKSPQRIQAIATQDLGMIIPKSVYYASASVLPSGKTGPDEQATANHTTSIFTRKAEAGGRR
jgi:cell division protein FtsL